MGSGSRSEDRGSLGCCVKPSRQEAGGSSGGWRCSQGRGSPPGLCRLLGGCSQTPLSPPAPSFRAPSPAQTWWHVGSSRDARLKLELQAAACLPPSFPPSLPPSLFPSLPGVGSSPQQKAASSSGPRGLPPPAAARPHVLPAALLRAAPRGARPHGAGLAVRGHQAAAGTWGGESPQNLPRAAVAPPSPRRWVPLGDFTTEAPPHGRRGGGSGPPAPLLFSS